MKRKALWEATLATAHSVSDNGLAKSLPSAVGLIHTKGQISTGPFLLSSFDDKMEGNNKFTHTSKYSL